MIRKDNFSIISRPAPTGSFVEPSAALANEKLDFGASRRARGFELLSSCTCQSTPKEKQMVSTNLLEAIRVVKENEWIANEFYADAAEKAGSAMGRELFKQLREFEIYHYARITALEKSLQEDDNYIVYEGREFPLPPALAPEAADEPEHQTVINIIIKALDLERQAEKAYADLAAQIMDKQGHEMFQRLSEEEHKHYQILTGAYWDLSNLQAWKWPEP
jgi:rubrerythrin